MGLLVPRRVADARVADQINAEVDQQIEAAYSVLEPELKKIDPTLSVVLAKDSADPDEFDYPGYWYVRKRMTTPPDEFFPLVGPNGERLHPDLHCLDLFKAADLWNPRVHRDRQEARDRLRQARVRAKKLEAEQRQDEGLLAARAALRVAGSGGMRKRAWGRGTNLVLPAGIED